VAPGDARSTSLPLFSICLSTQSRPSRTTASGRQLPLCKGSIRHRPVEAQILQTLPRPYVVAEVVQTLRIALRCLRRKVVSTDDRPALVDGYLSRRIGGIFELIGSIRDPQ